jgi:hypothetical protein
MGREEHREQPLGPQAESGLVTERARSIVCAHCGAEITDEREAIAISGQHAHELVNPSGQVFRIRCFGAAPGAAPVGEASTFFSWFAGYAWRVVVCGRCLTHLGWRFEGDSTFHGLIAERIAET